MSGAIAIPDFEWFCELVTGIFDAVQEVDEGEPTKHIPQLASADRSLFAVSVTTVDGQRFSLGDALSKFSLQSCSAPVTYVLYCIISNLKERERERESQRERESKRTVSTDHKRVGGG